ncbi:hypothetical protein AAFF_G00204060 [Aldrovandia affinis]|uniref:E-selectin n=1 Tax=Aldrovandia affinis TaxID=143900 RepID=A0AAD7W503_9TELE|nr:hypothetical protein AAFF_G00204060 [Aldrovandia affinis]
MRGYMFSFRPESQHMKVKWILILIGDILMTGYTLGWTYHYSNNAMNWTIARQWCQDHYTDLVAIQNEHEISYLTQNFPKRDKYYWLGIRKINDTWTWIGTNKTLKNGSWAQNEPNNREKGEDCVEIYIKRNIDSGKWNDEKCEKEKHPLCFKAQCNAITCSDRGECTEAINKYNCECAPGFKGFQCQHAVQCESPATPQHGWIDCQGPYGNHSYSSTCEFRCAEGFSLQGQPNNVTCNSSGNWTVKTPSCKGVECKVLSEPENGYVNCSASSTTWTCQFRCSTGFLLLGPKKVTCNAAGIWTGKIPICASLRYVAAAIAGASILSTSCFILFCLMHCRKRKKIVQTRIREEDIPQTDEEPEVGML